MTKKIKNAPGWLGLSKDRTTFVYLPDRAEIVRQIFDLSIRGMGGYTIAKFLNSKNVPAFGTSMRWDQSTIHNMLSNRATIGEYQRKKTIDGKEFPVGDPIPNYYPAVLDESIFQAAQEARRANLSSGRGRKGRLITNLFAGLPTCSYCERPMKFHSNGQYKSLICKTVLEQGGCHRFGWSYRNFEGSFFDLLEKNDVHTKFSEQLTRLRTAVEKQSEKEIYNARAEIAHLFRTMISTLVIASAGRSPPHCEPNSHIRRDYPGRHFTVTFSDGSTHIGSPTVAAVDVQRTLELSPLDLSKKIGLSPRQGEITALLAGGDTLTRAAEKLGMTLETARWHLRAIFRRTDTHSQNELISLAERTCMPDGADLG